MSGANQIGQPIEQPEFSYVKVEPTPDAAKFATAEGDVRNAVFATVEFPLPFVQQSAVQVTNEVMNLARRVYNENRILMLIVNPNGADMRFSTQYQKTRELEPLLGAVFVVNETDSLFIEIVRIAISRIGRYRHKLYFCNTVEQAVELRRKVAIGES